MNIDIKSNVAYIYDSKLISYCDRLPMVQNRASMVHDLITSYNLLKSPNIDVILSKPAKDEELKYFHSTEFVDFLKTINTDHTKEYDDQEEFGLAYDCSIIENTYDVITSIAGSSLTAAKVLVGSTKYKYVINWCGGWHHAQRHKAEGFCYVNDIVIAIHKLNEKYKRVLYIDLDVHHGDGVQNAFELSRNVLTLSFHKLSPGFYPGTGSLDDVGYLKGKYFSLNVPFLDYIGDDNYISTFKPIFEKVYSSYNPEVIVVQCGADIIKGDKVGECNLTLEAMGSCIKDILRTNLPCIFLGGGGYNFPNTARYWTYLTSIILNNSIPNEIPDESEYFLDYLPTYELSIPKGAQYDSNKKDYLNNVILTINKYCDIIASLLK